MPEEENEQGPAQPPQPGAQSHQQPPPPPDPGVTQPPPPPPAQEPTRPAESPQPPLPPAASYPQPPPGPGWRARTRSAGARRPVQLVAAGLVGALLGGGLVATLDLLDDDGHDGPGNARFERVPPGYRPDFGPDFRGGPGWRVPHRQWQVQPPGQPTQPTQPPQPAPTATPTR